MNLRHKSPSEWYMVTRAHEEFGWMHCDKFGAFHVTVAFQNSDIRVEADFSKPTKEAALRLCDRIYDAIA